MTRKLDPGSDRHQACAMAIAALFERYKSGPKIEQATGLRQPTINKFQKHGTLGIDFADQVAAVYETTIDGLVWLFFKEGTGALRAGNIPGWQRAVEEAESSWGESSYTLAAEVVLPTVPRVATARFVYDLAQVFHVHIKTSSIRAAVRKTGG